MNYQKIYCDICVVGLGSGGFGAALRAADSGLSVVGIDQNPMPGGTSVYSGVNSWERGIGGNGIHKYIFENLYKSDNACIDSYAEFLRETPLCAFVRKNKFLDYKSTLRRRYGGIIVFEPDAMANLMNSILISSGVNGIYNTSFISSDTDCGKISCITVYNSDCHEYIKIYAKVFIDCSADIHVAIDSGCQYEFNPDGPMNSSSPMFRITPKKEKGIDVVPDNIKPEIEEVYKRKSVSILNEYPNGDFNVNSLIVMDGGEYYSLSAEKRLEKARKLALAHWYYIQNEHEELRHYEIKCLFTRVGVREGPRLVGKYVLTEEDVRNGYKKQNKKESLVAFADHAVDNHASDSSNALKELEQPYGIPYECLLPKEVSNLLVACRGSSFSRVAASTCRLSRTMLAMGEAAGEAARMSVEQGISVHEIHPVTKETEELSWPLEMK